MKKKIFKAAKGAMFMDDKAQVYGEFISSLADSHEETITPPEIVRAASPHKSPLHDYFEWDDSAAGELYRVHQARELLGHIIEVVIDAQTQEEREIKAFYNVVLPDNKTVYVTAKTVANDVYFRDQIIEKALREVKGWQERYKEYKELGLIFGAIKETQKRIFSNAEMRTNV